MKVLEVKANYDYQCIMTENRESLKPLVRRMINPIGEIEFPDFYVTTPKAHVGNFYEMGYDLLAYDNVARDTLSYEVSVAGESYSLELEDVGTLNVLNVIETCDAVDHDKSVWRDEDNGAKIVLLKYVFRPERLITKSGLFRVAENRYSRLFAVTGAPGQKGDFYARYQKAGLTGLVFDERWSDVNQ